MAGEKLICISGITRGLGRALACEMSARGWRVSGCGRNVAALQSLREELPGTALLITADVSVEEEVRQFAREVFSRAGIPDLLMNNAAVINTPAPLWKVTAEEFSCLTSVNLNGMHLMLRHFIPEMLRKKSGIIVNLSSGWGRSTSPEFAPYCATKWGVEGLTRALAQELPDGLAAIALNPGIIDTDMLKKSFGSTASSFPRPEQWAKRAGAFLEKLNASHNGQSLSIPE